MDHSGVARSDGGNDFVPREIPEGLSDLRTHSGCADGLLHRRSCNPAWRRFRTGVQGFAVDDILVFRVFGCAGKPRGMGNWANEENARVISTAEYFHVSSWGWYRACFRASAER